MSWFFSICLLLSPQSAPSSDSPLQLVTHLPPQSDWITSLAIAPDGTRLVAGGYDFVAAFQARGWSRSEVSTACGAVRSLAFSPAGDWLAIGGHQRIRLHRVLSAGIRSEPEFVLRGHRGRVTRVVFVPDRPDNMLSASLDGTVRLWDLESRSGQVLLDAKSPIQDLAVHADRLAIACGDPDRPTQPGVVQVRDISTGELTRTLTPHTRAATGVRFLSDGLTVVSTGYDEVVLVHPLDSGEARVFDGHARPTRCVCEIGPDCVATTSGGEAVGKNELKVWRPSDLTELFSVELHKGPVTALACDAATGLLATGSHDKTVAVFQVAASLRPPPKPKILRVGIIGLDTSHSPAFTKAMNDEKATGALAQCRVVAAYPHGSKDIESSASRIPRYTEEMKSLGIEIVDSVDELLSKVDAVLLETNDGRLHLEQFHACARAGKPVFIDKPVAARLEDVLAIYDIATHYKVPMFSSSSLRYSSGVQAIRKGAIGSVLGCDAYSPCSLEKTHSDLFWYGIHGVEILYTAMGRGCESVTRASTPAMDVVTGTWADGRIGTFRGIRKGKTGYGGTAFGEKAIQSVGGYEGYRPLVLEIAEFFQTGKAPVDPLETIELYSFMAAAEVSSREGGRPVKIAEVMSASRKLADARLQQFGINPPARVAD